MRDSEKQGAQQEAANPHDNAGGEYHPKDKDYLEHRIRRLGVYGMRDWR